jgi:uridine kinase
MSRSLVVGIAGGTGSGKTTVAHKLAAAMPPQRCVAIEHDAYYRDQSHLPPDERALITTTIPPRSRARYSPSIPRALHDGRAADVPSYDSRLTRRPDRGARARAGDHRRRHSRVSGQRVARQMDAKIFVDTDPDIRLMRWIAATSRCAVAHFNRCAISITRRCD